MLVEEIINSTEYKKYTDAKGVEFINILMDSKYSGGRTILTNLFVKVMGAELIENSPYLYFKTSLIGKANKEIRYGKM